MTTRSKQALAVTDQSEALGLYLEALFRHPQSVDQEVNPQTPSTGNQSVDQTKTITRVGTRSAWTRQAFQTLFIDIGGMEIAVPMEATSGICKYPDHLTQLPAMPPWIDGVFKVHGQHIKVVNGRRLLMNQHSGHFETDPQYRPEFIVRIGDGGWGLACQSADRAIMLEPEQVRWSSDNRRRRWVLGIIRQHLCALLDVEEFVHYLETGANSL